ncbi:MAG TPA: hypothetical protein VI248_20630 [Kineosporiaceae bacterium]
MTTVRTAAALATLTLCALVSACASPPSAGGAGTSPTAPAVAATPAPSAPSSSSPSAPSSPSATVTPVAAPAVASGCENLTVTATVKASVTQAHRVWAHLDHIRPVPGTFYYGRCGAVEYAGTRFEPAPGATYNDGVALQDDGAAMMYYSRTPGGAWRHIATSGVEPTALGCTKLPQIPHALALLWHDCPQARG